jgi:membrane protease YdiL (CAAX protease family)
VLPFAVYLAFLTVQSTENLLWMYPLKTITVAAVLWYFRQEYTELRMPRVGNVLWAIVIGLVVIVIWIGIDPYYPKFGELWRMLEGWLNSFFGKPAPAAAATPPFDPTTIANPAARYAFIGFRVFGATVVVAFMEEIFWRGFLIRWLIKEDFQNVPMGTSSRSSFWITVLMFGAEHNQWLAGLICGALYNWLYYRRKDLCACVIAHAVSNAALAAWVLARGDWKFW